MQIVTDEVINSLNTFKTPLKDIFTWSTNEKQNDLAVTSQLLENLKSKSGNLKQKVFFCQFEIEFHVI